MIQVGSFVELNTGRYVPMHLMHNIFVVDYVKADGRCGLRMPFTEVDEELRGIVLVISQEFLKEVGGVSI